MTQHLFRHQSRPQSRRRGEVRGFNFKNSNCAPVDPQLTTPGFCTFASHHARIQTHGFRPANPTAGMGLFSNLPAELVEEIVAAFCVECTPGEERRCFDANCGCRDDDHTGAVASLASLCLTSRHLNSVATRHLYHRLHCNRWWLLARTLITRRDLAQVAKGMRFGNRGSVGKKDCPPEVLAYFEEQREAYLDGLPERMREGALSRREEEDDLYKGNGNIQLDIMTSLCPNLETLHASISYFDAFRFCKPQSMMSLHSIVLSHADTEYGIHLENAEPLFRAAPNITNMIFHMLASSDSLDFTLDKVTTLDLQYSTIDGQSLVNVFMACPNLETFRYRMGGAIVSYEQFTVAEARDAFLAHAPNLKSVCLDSESNDQCSDEWDGSEMEDMGRMLEERGIRFEFSPYQYQDGTAGFQL